MKQEQIRKAYHLIADGKGWFVSAFATDQQIEDLDFDFNKNVPEEHRELLGLLDACEHQLFELLKD